jgi:hypothetical protein
LNPRLRNLMVRKWSMVPISLSYTTPQVNEDVWAARETKLAQLDARLTSESAERKALQVKHALDTRFGQATQRASGEVASKK